MTLTTDSLMSHYGIPVLWMMGRGSEYGPADDVGCLTEFFVANWASQPGRTEVSGRLSLDHFYSFFRCIPDIPQGAKG